MTTRAISTPDTIRRRTRGFTPPAYGLWTADSISLSFMAGLRLYAIAIDEARDLIGATPEVAMSVRADPGVRLAEAEPPKRGLFGRLRKATTPPDPNLPTAADLETVLAGGYPAPDRADVCWRLVEQLIGHRSWGSLVLDLDARGLDDFDFAVARAGAPSEIGLVRLIHSPARLGLPDLPGQMVGYVPDPLPTRGAGILAGLELGNSPFAASVAALAEFLGAFPQWTAEARTARRPVPDLIAFHSDSGSTR